MRSSPLLRLALAASLLLSGACAPRRIPGTEIDDTSETRAILGLMEKYRSALEARDAGAVVSLVADTFKDDGGTATTEDDLDYKSLSPALNERLARIAELKLDLTVKKILFHEDQTASAIYNYTTSFKMPGLTSKVETASEIKQMWFTRAGDGWKISSGI